MLKKFKKGLFYSFFVMPNLVRHPIIKAAYLGVTYFAQTWHVGCRNKFGMTFSLVLGHKFHRNRVYTMPYIFGCKVFAFKHMA